MKYDDASWHFGGDFPKDLPIEAGATHTGMFIAWAFLSGLIGELHVEESQTQFVKLRNRTITPGRFFLETCDGKFTNEDLNEEGNEFARSYFDFEHGQYVKDYEATLCRGLPTQYHAPDTWESFDKLKPVLDQRFAGWQSKRQ